MGSSDNFTPDIAQRLLIAKLKEADWSSNEVNYVWLMLEHNHCHTHLDYMQETRSYRALQGWYNIDDEMLIARCLILSMRATRPGIYGTSVYVLI